MKLDKLLIPCGEFNLRSQCTALILAIVWPRYAYYIPTGLWNLFRFSMRR